jgi:hypothetical protein
MSNPGVIPLALLSSPTKLLLELVWFLEYLTASNKKKNAD